MHSITDKLMERDGQTGDIIMPVAHRTNRLKNLNADWELNRWIHCAFPALCSLGYNSTCQQ